MNKLLPLGLSLLLSASLANAQYIENCPHSKRETGLPLEDLSSVINAEHAFIIFGASWCGPCEEIYPVFDHLNELVEEADRPQYLAMGYVDVDSSALDFPFLKRCVVSYPSIVETLNGLEVRRYGSDEMDKLKPYIHWLINNN